MSQKSNKIELKKALISYTGVVLDQASQDLLRKRFNYYIDPLTPIADHMTIVVGELKPHDKEILGREVELVVTELGQDEGVIAAGVETDIVVYDKKPHITLAVGPNVRPSASNEITKWRPIRHPFKVKGVIQEVPAGLDESDDQNRRGVVEPDDMDPALKQNGYSPLYPITHQQGASALMEGRDVNHFGAMLGMHNIVKALNALPFKEAVYKAGGEIYAVGGVVRDALVNKPSSDLDLVVRGIPADELLAILKKFGWAEINGTNFGTINFKTKDAEFNSLMDELGFEHVLDLALPRTDQAGDGGGHKDIVANVDHKLPIKRDLERRDFTINSMAMTVGGQIVDPFGGHKDLRNGRIKWTNKEAFLDDPLRTIRAIRFAAVYDYELDAETNEAIRTHVKDIANLPKERLMKEFQKLQSKGGGVIYQRAFKLMIETGAFKVIFGFDPVQSEIPLVERLGDFIYCILRGSRNRPELLFTKTLKGDTNTAKYIQALNYTELEPNDVGDAREIASHMYAVHADSLESPLVTGPLEQGAQELLTDKYPKNLKGLEVNGNDLMSMGYKGKQLGDELLKLLKAVHHDQLPNEREALLKSINDQGEQGTTTVGELREALETESGVTHLIVLDMDKTMLITPEPKDGTKIWKFRTRQAWSKISWWGAADSMNPEIFHDVIQPRPDIKAIYDKYVNDPRVMIMLLTNRLDKPDLVKNIMVSLNKYYPDLTIIPNISFLKGQKTKIDRLLEVLKSMPSIRHVDFYDDQEKHFSDAHKLDQYGVEHVEHVVK